jgi:hypothetical protein
VADIGKIVALEMANTLANGICLGMPFASVFAILECHLFERVFF